VGWATKSEEVKEDKDCTAGKIHFCPTAFQVLQLLKF